MHEFTLTLERSSPLTLQDQLRRHVVDAIHAGALPPGCRMPSSRSLAQRLGVSRNTVIIAYGDLVADGYLETRARSGYYVARAGSDGRIIGRRAARSDEPSSLAERMRAVPADRGVRCPPQWREYPYPFLDGRVDTSLLPLAEWRRAVRLASNPRDVTHWSGSNGELDDPMLVDEIRTKVLPEFGINALSDEVLIGHSMRQLTRYLLRLLLQPGISVWMEEPVDPELLAWLDARGVQVGHFHAAGERVPDGAIVVTSARGGMAHGGEGRMARLLELCRRGCVVIEQGLPADTLERDARAQALYARADAGSVVHVGMLSPVAACAQPPAWAVAEADVITLLRRKRRLAGALPSLTQQRIWAWFLSLGHYGAALESARAVLGARKTALRDALNHYLHAQVSVESTPGVSAYWVRRRNGRGARALATQAAGAGVLLQPARLDAARNGFLLGVTSLPEEHIRDGVRVLARLLRSADQRDEAQAAPPPEFLHGAALRRAVAGKTLLYNTVYGEPCTIRVRRSGELVGAAGYANDDLDEGRWWIEDGRWFRQWQTWAYGEAEGFHVAVEDDRIYWFDEAGELVDQAMILVTPRGQKPRSSS